MSKQSASKRFYSKNKVYFKNYYRKNKKRLLKLSRDWKEKNKHKHKDYVYKYLYNIDVSIFKSLKRQQKHKCAICNKRVKLFVDHCHKTGKVRALLCNKCNIGLGAFMDNINNLQKAVKFLRKYA